MTGPQTEAAERLHAMKYRQPDAHRDRAMIVLGTIAKRNETPHLKLNTSIPEFDPKAVHR